MILGGYEMIFPGAISKMPYLTHGKSRAINAENRTGKPVYEKYSTGTGRIFGRY